MSRRSVHAEERNEEDEGGDRIWKDAVKYVSRTSN
jgi:hypothetical protein